MESDFVDVTPDGGVQKRILTAGQGDSPQTNSTCKIYFLGTLEDEKPFDSNQGQSKPHKHILKRGDRCKGFEIALQSMKPGEKSQFKISPQYGYGEEGCIFKNVPKNANLKYEIELLSFKLEKKKRWQMNPLEKYEEALKIRGKGTKQFKNQNYFEAKEKYKDALTYCALDTKEGKELKASLQLNLSICCFLQQEYKESIDYAKAALETSSNNQQNVKAYYRRAIALQQIGEQEKALADLKSAYNLDPQNTAVIEELQKVKEHLKVAYSKEKQSWSKLFKERGGSQQKQQVEESCQTQENEKEPSENVDSKDNANQYSQDILKQEVPQMSSAFSQEKESSNPRDSEEQNIQE
ncbi:unnamed protein product (macronuclear) [Paramecium tetraurelia]|uniref:peptidylprolyl isomerase n=1 Tax=Paramecium tetraurelia TaxID=5888 RepID=A0C1K6_PARTE|nr:uncharacterized protein GSPATT00034150001 [Paramecium tetraurelia]CAK64673.1 unnamed protein product [Paramecium tetraurelia]|eukprot:XP_001432070.1 hypothetical protein (macronuclear) [Paramecium tetraurelia strain d4-2]